MFGLSQRTYISRVLKKFVTERCYPRVASIVSGNKSNKLQCPRKEIKREKIRSIHYASIIESLSSVQGCTCPIFFLLY